MLTHCSTTSNNFFNIKNIIKKKDCTIHRTVEVSHVEISERVVFDNLNIMKLMFVIFHLKYLKITSV